jgi:antitoxin HicB
MKKNPHMGSSLDDFLKEEGIYEEALAHALKSVSAWKAKQKMKKKSPVKSRTSKSKRK